jgi:hypothetical protein
MRLEARAFAVPHFALAMCMMMMFSPQYTAGVNNKHISLRAIQRGRAEMDNNCNVKKYQKR